MRPIEKEEINLKDYGDNSDLGLVEQFVKVLLDILFSLKQFDTMWYKKIKKGTSFIKNNELLKEYWILG